MLTNHIRTRSFVLALACSASLTAIAAAADKKPHLDLWLHPERSSLVVGSISEGTPGDPVDAVARVFGAELGEDPEFPFAAFEPGFQSLPGRVTAGATFTFSLSGPLLVWDGSDLVPSDHTMTVSFGPASVVSDSGPVPGFNFTSQPSGLMHIHFDYVLSGPLGDPTPGVYALPIDLGMATPPLAPAPTSWLVFNLGQDEATHDAAITFAERYLACGIDLSGDGTVDAEDLAVLLGAWGSDDAGSDLDGSGEVDAADLAELLGAWGFTCGG